MGGERKNGRREKGRVGLYQSISTSAVLLRRLKIVSWGTAYRVRGTTTADMYGLSVEVSGERPGGARNTCPYSDPFFSVERGRDTSTSLMHVHV